MLEKVWIGAELLGFFWQYRWWWLAPAVLIILLFGLVIVLGQSSWVAPFIYTLV